MPIKGGRHVVQVLCYLALLMVTEDGRKARSFFNSLFKLAPCI
jgi:hypothetical protein